MYMELKKYSILLEFRNGPRFVKGVINLRGVVTPIIDFVNALD